MRLRLSVFLLAIAAVAQAAEIKGKVTNAVGGEALGRVEVVVLEGEMKTSAVTSLAGEFDLPNLAPGAYTLRLNAVGYRMLTIAFTLASAADVKEFSITMVPDNFHHTDKVEVHGDVFQAADSPATVETNLTGTEIRETSTVFADDPFRAVQTLPGVSAEGNNEFFAEFSVMGAPFSNISIYIDDVLVPSPFHEIGNSAEGASLGVLTSEVVEEMKLLPAAYPEKFGDAIGAALDVRTREGSRGAPLFRLTAGIAASELLGEGGLGSAGKGSWLVSARRSYINYLVRGRVANAADVDFYDGDLKLNYDLTSRQNVSFFATGGHTDMTMNDPASLAIDEFGRGKSDFSLARTGWRWSVSPHLLLEARGAYFREPEDLRNTANQILLTNDYQGWVGGASATWNWFKDSVLEAGWTPRHLRNSYSTGYFDPTTGVEDVNQEQGTGLRQNAYAQESSSLLRGRLHVLGSVRWDRSLAFLPQRFSPQISMALQVARATELQFTVGRYSQFSDDVFNAPPGFCVADGALPPKSDHFAAAVEQRLGENTRIRLEAFQRKNFYTFGAISPGPVNPSSCPVLQPLPGGTFQRDYSQGVQFVVQRRSANRLSGWLGYTLLQARERQFQISTPYPVTNPQTLFNNTGYYPTLEDQRNSLTLFAMYRLRPTVNLSGKLLYGSGFPIPSGTFVQLSNGQYVETGLNQSTLGAYQRLDCRVDKDWAFKRWKLTLYGEVLNLTNHYNARYAYTSGVDPNTGQAQIKTLQGLPITPTAGLAFQF
jgi:carboxypeptidase family protein